MLKPLILLCFSLLMYNFGFNFCNKFMLKFKSYDE